MDFPFGFWNISSFVRLLSFRFPSYFLCGLEGMKMAYRCVRMGFCHEITISKVFVSGEFSIIIIMSWHLYHVSRTRSIRASAKADEDQHSKEFNSNEVNKE